MLVNIRDVTIIITMNDNNVFIGPSDIESLLEHVSANTDAIVATTTPPTDIVGDTISENELTNAEHTNLLLDQALHELIEDGVIGTIEIDGVTYFQRPEDTDNESN